MSDRRTLRTTAGVVAVVALVVAGCASGESAVPVGLVSTVPVVTTAPTVPVVSVTSTVPVATTLAPITGYGDYSHVESVFYLDAREAQERAARCVQDRGFPVTFDPVTGGIFFSDVPDEQNQQAGATLAACIAGLNLPELHPFTDDQLAVIYAYRLAVAGCLESEGYSVAAAPSLEVFVDTWRQADNDGEVTVWTPHASVRDLSVERVCPQSPVGGLGAWQPGDPITPIP